MKKSTNKIIYNLLKIIKKHYGEFNNLNQEQYNELNEIIDQSIRIFYPNIINEYKPIIESLFNKNNIYEIDEKKLNLLNSIDNNINNEKIKMYNWLDHETVESRDEYYDKLRYNIIHNMKELNDQYELLINLPQPVQKSKEWFDLRSNMITASSCAAAIGEEKYKTIKNIIEEKIGLGKGFPENKFVYHGKKYEKIAILIYEQIYNSKIGEFGLIPHPTLSFLGASPDGINMNMTLDGKSNPLLGRMLEIKCPLMRKIKREGEIDDGICPHYYWVQVQVQLECCNLYECDFWQCDLIEYDNKEEYLEDDCKDTLTTVEQNKQIFIDERIKKGCIIEFIPKDKSKIPEKDEIIWYAKYIYPSNILINAEEYDEWIKYQLENVEKLYPEIYKNYEYSRVVYWKLRGSHNVLINREKDWFSKSLPKFRKIWSVIEYYRNNKEYIEQDFLKTRFTQDIYNKIFECDIYDRSLLQYKKNEISNNVLDLFLDDDDNKVKPYKNTYTKNYSNSYKKPVKKQEEDLFLSSDNN